MADANERTECVSTEWPPKVDLGLIVQRVFALFGIALATAGIFVSTPLELKAALGLSALVAALFGLVLYLAAKLPPAPAGVVVSQGRPRPRGRS